MQTSPAGTALLGAGVVVLCGLSAWLGGTLARPSAGAQPQRSSRDAELQSYIDQLDRRVENLERKIDAASANAQAALDMVTELRNAQPVSPVGGPGAGTAPSNVGGANPRDPVVDPKPPVVEKTAAQQFEDARIRMNVMSPGLVRHELDVIADESVEGAQNRGYRATGEAKSTAATLGVNGEEDQEKIRAIFQDQYDAAHREMGPLVREGLDKQEPAVLTGKMKALWADTDRRMKELLDAEQWKLWESLVATGRERVVYTFDQIKR